MIKKLRFNIQEELQKTILKELYLNDKFSISVANEQETLKSLKIEIKESSELKNDIIVIKDKSMTIEDENILTFKFENRIIINNDEELINCLKEMEVIEQWLDENIIKNYVNNKDVVILKNIGKLINKENFTSYKKYSFQKEIKIKFIKKVNNLIEKIIFKKIFNEMLCSKNINIEANYLEIFAECFNMTNSYLYAKENSFNFIIDDEIDLLLKIENENDFYNVYEHLILNYKT